MISDPHSYSWLQDVLLRHGMTQEKGVLVSLSSVPEQQGDFLTGIWLSDSRNFWAFEAVVSRPSSQLLSIDRFADETVSTIVDTHAPAIGASFGFLALEVLNEIRGV